MYVSWLDVGLLEPYSPSHIAIVALMESEVVQTYRNSTDRMSSGTGLPES